MDGDNPHDIAAQQAAAQNYQAAHDVSKPQLGSVAHHTGDAAVPPTGHNGEPILAAIIDG